MSPHERSSTFVTVNCACGRVLRAKSNQVGTEVRCWDCHQMVAVPLLLPKQDVARELSDGALTVIKGPGLHLILAGAALITAALFVPTYGVWCSILVLASSLAACGEFVGRISERGSEDLSGGWVESLLPRFVPKIALCLFLASGIAVPLWWINSGLHRSPHLNLLGASILAVTWIVGPFLMLLTFGRKDANVPLGVRRCLELWARHPFAMGLTVAIVPLMLAFAEFAVSFALYLHGELSFYTLDFMPMPSAPEPPVVYNGIPHYRLLDYRSLPSSVFEEGYLAGLRAGYSFLGSIPPSLSKPTSADLDPEAIGLSKFAYLIFKGLIVMIFASFLLAAHAIQAQWIGSIPALERRMTF